MDLWMVAAATGAVYIAKHWQQNLHSRVNKDDSDSKESEHHGQPQEDPYYDGIAKLKTMTMIINETLRLYPPAAQLSRQVNNEVRLGKLIIPANTQCFIACLKIHHDPQIWGEDAHLFKPDRFSEGVAKAIKSNPATFLPFGMGPRNCVGTNFSNTEAKIALSMILQRYSFTLSPGYVHSPALLITVIPQHGVHVILHPFTTTM